MRCVYAGPDGVGCAVGILLPRTVAEAWDQRGETLEYLLQTADAPEELKPHKDLLVDMQSAHDTAARRVGFVATFKGMMTILADRRGLTVPA